MFQKDKVVSMLLVIDIDEIHLKIIKDRVEKGETEFYPYIKIANGKPLSEILYQNSWEQHVNLLKEIYKNK